MASNPLDEFDTPQRAGNPLDEFDHPEPVGVTRQLVGGISKAIVDTATLPYRAITEGGRDAYARRIEREKAGDFSNSWLPAIPPDVADRYAPRLEDMSAYRPFVVQPEPQGMGERIARSTGEAIGSTAVPTAGVLGKAEKLRALAPTTVPRAFGKQIGEFFAETPGKAVVADVVGSAASGVGQQAAREANFGPGYEIAAGAVAPVAPIAGMAGAERAVRAVSSSGRMPFSPTLARWKANSDGILRRMGIEASADGGMPDNLGARAAADQTLVNQLRRAGKSVDDLEEVLNNAADARRFHSSGEAPNALATVDLDQSLQKTAGSLVRSSPEAHNTGSDFMYARQTGLVPARGDVPRSAGLPTREMFSEPLTGAQAKDKLGSSFGTPDDKIVPMGAYERVRDALKRALRISDSDYHGHAANANRTDKQLIDAAEEAAKVNYGELHAAGVGVDVRPAVEPVLQRWESALKEEVGPISARLQKYIADMRRMLNLNNASKTSIERFDKQKQFIDGELQQLYNSPDQRNPYTARVIRQFKNELIDAVDGIQEKNVGPLYKKARNVFSSHAESREAIQAGRDSAKAEPDVGSDLFRNYAGNESNEKFFRLGIVGAYEKQHGGKSRGTDATKFFDNPNIEALLTEVIPRSKNGTAEFADRPQRLGRYIGNENMMTQSNRRVFGGSQTQANAVDDEAHDVLSAVAEKVKNPSVLKYTMQATSWALNKAFGYRADTAAELAKSLFTADERTQRQLLFRLRERMGEDRLTYFTRLMQAQAREYGALGAATAVPPTVTHGTPDNPVPVRTPQEADTLPSGTHFTTPGGRQKVKP